MTQENQTIDLLDVSECTYKERLTANCLQGLANREGPRLFLDYGNYDDPGTRKTNSVQMTEENWFGKYRDFLNRNDLDNLDYYQTEYDLKVNKLDGLSAAIEKYGHLLKGLVVWDPALIDSVNLALMLAGLDNLLVCHPDQIADLEALTGLTVREDLRGRFSDRVALYRWAYEHLFSQCKPGQVAHMEPAWQAGGVHGLHRPEQAVHLLPFLPSKRRPADFRTETAPPSGGRSALAAKFPLWHTTGRTHSTTRDPAAGAGFTGDPFRDSIGTGGQS